MGVEFEDIFVQVISDGMRDGALRNVGPPWIVAYGILGMFGWTSRWFNPSIARADADEIAGTFIETLLGGLVCPSGRPVGTGGWRAP